MAREIERTGIPAAFVSAIPSIPLAFGVNRIVRGKAIMHPVGDPTLTPERERRFRRRLVETALRSLATELTGPTVFQLSPSEKV